MNIYIVSCEVATTQILFFPSILDTLPDVKWSLKSNNDAITVIFGHTPIKCKEKECEN